jgi:hypothetical protein
VRLRTLCCRHAYLHPPFRGDTVSMGYSHSQSEPTIVPEGDSIKVDLVLVWTTFGKRHCLAEACSLPASGTAEFQSISDDWNPWVSSNSAITVVIPVHREPLTNEAGMAYHYV